MDNEAQAAEEGRRLLLDILPLFTSSQEEFELNKDLGFRAYYYMICSEAKILEDLLKDCDIKAAQYADILGKALKLFESLIKPDILPLSKSFPRIHDSKYERLLALRSRVQAVKRNCESFLDLQSYLHFGNRQDETRDIHWSLIQCNKAFSANDEILLSWAPEGKVHKRNPAYEVREYASILYQILLDKLPGCGKTGHEARLCLSRYESCEELDSEIDFDILFSTHTPKWQESKIGMMVKMNESRSAHVRFDTLTTKTSPTKKRTVRREIDGKICTLIESTAKAKGFLYMHVDHNRKLYRVVSETPQRRGRAHTHNTVSMKAVVEKLEENRTNTAHNKKNPILGRKHKRIIAVHLAHALMQYCGSEWLSERWDKTSISFLRHSSGDRLVLSSHLKSYNPEPDLDAEGRSHCYPGILALAILMLEMELSKTIETARCEQENFTDDNSADPDADLNVAWNMFEEEEIQDDTIPGFKAAVEACLKFSYFNHDTESDDLINHRQKLYDDIYLRQKIYQEVIMPLERELLMSFPDLNLDESLRFTFWDHIKSPIQPTGQDRKVNCNAVSSILDLSLKQSSDPGTSITTLIVTGEQFDGVILHQVFFHDVHILASDESRKLSQDWMDVYMNACDKLMDRVIDRIDCSKRIETSRVKIAVLDTGIDWSDSFIRGAKDRIVNWKNWADDRQDKDSQQQVHDGAGHGTHVTALLLKTAPEAKIFVSRVANQNGAMISPEMIAKAIMYAVNTWEVDIITMSFGFRKPIIVIDEAIKYAFYRNVIMFAATSNDGGNDEVAFPASVHEAVIGVNSTDTWGGKSDFTPNVLTLSENFSILGEAVESSWPKHLNQGIRQCRSGTSYATPIAAGTAANMLFYVRMNVENEAKVKDVATCRGMKKLLLSMAAPIGGYRYIRPWILWNESEEDILAHIRMALK